MEAWAPLDWGDCERLRDVGVLGEVDARQAFSPSVIGEHLWFSVAPERGPQAIAHARLVDGAPVEDQLVLEGPDVGAADVSSPAVVEVEGGYRMFFDAITRGELGVWRCDSTDGLTWGDCAPLIAPSRAEDAHGAQIPFALPVEGGWRLWYSGVSEAEARSVLTAFSEDGLTFGPPELLIPPGWAGALDTTSAYSPFVLQDGAFYRLFYAGRVLEEGYLVKQLIEAWSPDAETWLEPTLSLPRGCAGADDAWRVDAPWVVREGDGYRLYYDGFDHPETASGRRRLLTAAGG